MRLFIFTVAALHRYIYKLNLYIQNNCLSTTFTVMCFNDLSNLIEPEIRNIRYILQLDRCCICLARSCLLIHYNASSDQEEIV